jgi:hypothetical protein
MSIGQHILIAIACMIAGISFMAMISLAIWSLYSLWYSFNSDVVERRKQIRKNRRSLNED